MIKKYSSWVGRISDEKKADCMDYSLNPMDNEILI